MADKDKKVTSTTSTPKSDPDIIQYKVASEAAPPDKKPKGESK